MGTIKFEEEYITNENNVGTRLKVILKPKMGVQFCITIHNGCHALIVNFYKAFPLILEMLTNYDIQYVQLFNPHLKFNIATLCSSEYSI